MWQCEAVIILITIIIIISMDENKKVEWGRGLRGIFELQAFFFICLIFPKEKCFRENPGTSLEEKKVETRILPRYSLGARVVPSPSTQIGELSFTTRKILPFYKSKERKSIKLSLKCMRSKTISHLSFGM